MDHPDRNIQECIEAVAKVHDRVLRNQLIRRTMDRARISVEVRLGMHHLVEFRQPAAMTSQHLRSLYASLEHVVAYCEVLWREVSSEIHRTAASAAGGHDKESRVLAKLTMEIFPTSFGELCDRITDLLVAVHREDVAMNGARRRVLAVYPDLCRNLRDLVVVRLPVG